VVKIEKKNGPGKRKRGIKSVQGVKNRVRDDEKMTWEVVENRVGSG